MGDTDNPGEHEAAHDAALQSALETAMAAHRQGRLGEAEAVYREVRDHAPGLAEPWHLLGVIRLQQGDPEAAIPLFQEALARDAGHVKCRTNLGAAYFQLHRFDDAERAFREALALDAGALDARYNLGNALMELGRDDDALAAFEAVLRAEPTHTGALVNAGVLQVRQHRHGPAADYFARALEQAPDDVAALLNHARACERLNRLAEADRDIAKVLALAPDDPDANFYAAKIDLRHRRWEEALDKLAKVVGKCDDDFVASDALYEQGKALTALDRADDAFAAFAKANARERAAIAGTAMSPAVFLERMALAHKRLDAGPVAAAPGADRQEGRHPPVFFIGFPRSGTTLFEQMLDMHRGVATTNEESPLGRLLGEFDKTRPVDAIDAPHAARLRERFWADADAITGGLDGRVLVDKMPLNFEVLDLAARLFPGARVVVALRDPRDVCLSCFMQHFERSPAMACFYDLDTTAAAYESVMSLWLRQRDMNLLPWVEFRYEDLVEDMPGTVGRVLDFLGLTWTDAILDFQDKARAGRVVTPSYQQIGEKLHGRAAGRWRKFERHLAPILPALEPYVRAFGYAP